MLIHTLITFHTLVENGQLHFSLRYHPLGRVWHSCHNQKFYQEELYLKQGFEASLCCRRGLWQPELVPTVMPTAHLLITDNVPHLN